MLKILSSEYQLYACGKIFEHALTLNENSNFLRHPLIIAAQVVYPFSNCRLFVKKTEKVTKEPDSYFFFRRM